MQTELFGYQIQDLLQLQPQPPSLLLQPPPRKQRRKPQSLPLGIYAQTLEVQPVLHPRHLGHQQAVVMAVAELLPHLQDCNHPQLQLQLKLLR